MKLIIDCPHTNDRAAPVEFLVPVTPLEEFCFVGILSRDPHARPLMPRLFLSHCRGVAVGGLGEARNWGQGRGEREPSQKLRRVGTVSRGLEAEAVRVLQLWGCLLASQRFTLLFYFPLLDSLGGVALPSSDKNVLVFREEKQEGKIHPTGLQSLKEESPQAESGQ